MSPMPGRRAASLSAYTEARGWAAAMSGEFRVEMRKTGQGQRSWGHTIQLSVRIEPQPVTSILSVTNASEIA